MKTPRISPKQAIRAALWLGPGFWAFVLDFLLFWALVLIWNQYRLVSFTLAFLLSCTFRFLLDRRYTYRPAQTPDEKAGQEKAGQEKAGQEKARPEAPLHQDAPPPVPHATTTAGWQKAKYTARQFLRYLVACILSMLAGMLAFYWGQHLGFGPLLSKLFSIPFTSGASELLFRFAVFRLSKT